MKAIILRDYGDVENLSVANVAEPTIGPDDVKIRVRAASVNPLDWKLLSGYGRGTALELHFPAVLGRDASGDVLETGDNVTTFRRGDHVLGFASSTFAEIAVAPEAAWAKLPGGLSVIEAAALPMVGLTGAQLAETVEPRPGLSVLVTGAVGGVGRVAVFVARAAGATVWAGVRADQKVPASALGANYVVAIDDDAAISALPTFDAICDTVGGETIAELLPHLKVNGVLGSTLGEPPSAREHAVKVRAIRTRPDSQRISDIAEATARGRLVMPVRRTFPFECAADAFRLARQGGIGKVLLLP